MQEQIDKRLIKNYYTEKVDSKNVVAYKSKYGWTNYLLRENMLFSHRINNYTVSNFPYKLHSDEVYEIVIYVEGDMQYISNDRITETSHGLVVVTKPSVIHTMRTTKPLNYDRYVLYFLPAEFESMCVPVSLYSFATNGYDNESNIFKLNPENEKKMFALLKSAENELLKGEDHCNIAAYSYIMQMFIMFCREETKTHSDYKPLPDIIAKIKNYVDDNFLNIHTVSEVAEHFFYSREYLSRLFAKFYNISMSDYIIMKKILHSKQLLLCGNSVTDVCYNSGFSNMSSYINHFTKQTGMTPSAYKKLNMCDKH